MGFGRVIKQILNCNLNNKKPGFQSRLVKCKLRLAVRLSAVGCVGSNRGPVGRACECDWACVQPGLTHTPNRGAVGRVCECDWPYVEPRLVMQWCAVECAVSNRGAVDRMLNRSDHGWKPNF